MKKKSYNVSIVILMQIVDFAIMIYRNDIVITISI